MILTDHEMGMRPITSCLMIFLYFIVVAFAMWFISLDWTCTIHVIARMAIFSALFVLAIWLPMVKKLDLNAGE